MKSPKRILLLSGLLAGISIDSAYALNRETEALLGLLQAKGVISGQEAADFRRVIEQDLAAEAAQAASVHPAQRTERNHDDSAIAKKEAVLLPQNVRISGLVEVEAGASLVKDANGGRAKASDLTLATGQIAADADFGDHVSSRLALKYEEGASDDHVFVDEGFVSLQAAGGEIRSFFVDVGKLYVPFGKYASHFVSDPVTLVLGETRDTAAIFGWGGELATVSVGAFNGEVNETGASDHVNSYVAAANFALPADLLPGVGVAGGVSWLSNLADSNTMRDLPVVTGEISRPVGGFSAWAGLAFAERFFLAVEYLGAARDFAAGDFMFADAGSRRPWAWNIEAAMAVAPELEFALRYERAGDLFHDAVGSSLAIPEKQYGAGLTYSLYDNVSLAVEYFLGDLAGGQTRRMGTAQLAVGF